MFPTFHAKDFQDIQQNNVLGDDAPPEIIPELECTSAISEEDAEFVSIAHYHFMFYYTKSEWLAIKNEKLIADFVTPVVEKFGLFKMLMNKCVESLNYTLDSEIIGSLSILVAVAQNYGNVNIEGKGQAFTVYYFCVSYSF